MCIYVEQVQESADTHTHTHPRYLCCIKTRELTQDGHCGGAETPGTTGLHKKHVLLGVLFTFLSTHFQ